MMRTGAFAFCIVSFSALSICPQLHAQEVGSLQQRPGKTRVIVPSTDPAGGASLEFVADQSKGLITITSGQEQIYHGPGALAFLGGAVLVQVPMGNFALGGGNGAEAGAENGNGTGSSALTLEGGSGPGGNNQSAMGGGGAGNAGPHNSMTAELLQSHFHCLLDDKWYGLNQMRGVTANQDPYTLQCPKHPFGLTDVAMQRWIHNNSDSGPAVNGDTHHLGIDISNYALACMPMRMSCSAREEVVYHDPAAYGYDLANPVAWTCPVHGSPTVGGPPSIADGIATFALSCAIEQAPKNFDLAKVGGANSGVSIPSAGGSLKKGKKSSDDDHDEVLFVSSGGFFFPGDAKGNPPSMHEAATISEASSSVEATAVGSASSSEGGNWGESGFTRGDGQPPSDQGGGSDSNSSSGGFFTSGENSSASSQSASSAVASALETASAVVAPAAVILIPQAKTSNSEEFVVADRSAMELALAAAVVALIGVYALRRIKESAATVLAKRLSLPSEISARQVAPVVLAKPQKRIDWSRYRHLVTDIVEDAVLAVRGWVAPRIEQEQPANRLTVHIQEPLASVAQAPCANRIAKKELAEALSS